VRGNFLLPQYTEVGGLDFALNDFGSTIWRARYALPSEDSWQDTARRVAKHVAQAEKDENRAEWTEKFNEIMAQGLYFPGGRVLHGAARQPGGLLNCFCLGVDDNRNSIAELMANFYLISTFGGGVGVNYSSIRPKGASIQANRGSAPGAVSEMRKIDAIGAQVKTGGGRRVALIATLDISHPDLLEFLDVKLDRQELTNHNISINISQEFLDAVAADEPWTFRFQNQKYNRYKMRVSNPTTGQRNMYVVAASPADAVATCENHYKSHWQDQFTVVHEAVVGARSLWARICRNAVECGEPGFQFTDTIRDNYATAYFESYSNCNPCTEALLPASGNCNLGSINLARMVSNNEFDYKLLTSTIHTAVRMLDDVLDVNVYPTPETRDVAMQSRRVGLGVMGLHHMLIELGIQYGSKECLEFLERLFATIRNEAFLASVELAKEKGSFPKFDYKQYSKNEFIRRLPTRIKRAISKNGIRNAVLLSIAPTGTISMVAGTSSGIEPIFAPVYLRRYRDGNATAEEVVVDPIFRDRVVANKKWAHIVGAYDVKPEQHLAVQATIQEYVDQAISKTINLPADYDWEDLYYLLAEFADKLKGTTVYRAGSRGEEPLTAIPTTRDNVRKYVREASAKTVSQDCAVGSCEI
jgi:ribonucleoside-diphosphate reductase alpha chain